MNKTNLLMKTLLLCLCMVGSVSAWADDYQLAASACSDQTTWTFEGKNFTLSPAHGGTGQTGYSDYIKFSKGKTYTLTLPETFTLTNINVKGYTNSNGKTDGELTSVAEAAQTGKTFPAKNDANLGTSTCITDGYDFAVSQKGGNIVFVAANTNQICVLITLTGSFEAATAPTIDAQPVSSVFQKDATGKTLTVEATPSSGSCSYEWFKCDDTNKTNPVSQGSSSTSNASLAISTSAESTSYYFCRVSDGGSNTTDTEVATVVVVDRAAKQTWDFTTISEDDIKYNSNTYFSSGFWTRKSSGVYNHNFDKATYGTLQDNFGNDLLNGIQVYRADGNAPVYVYCDADNSRYGINLQGASSKPGLWKIPVENGKAYKVTYTSNTNSTTLGYVLGGDATLVSGDLTATIETAFSSTPNFTVTATADGYMTLSNTGTDANNATLVKVEEVELDPEITSVTPDGGSVNGNSTVTIAGIGTIYYQWSESSSATIDTGEWTTSSTATVPNVGGTRYLHVYAANSTTNTEITTKTFTITKVGSVVVKSWDFTKELSSTDLANIEADGTNWNDAEDQSPNGTRYTNKVAMSGTVQANGETLEVLDGIQMYASTDSDIKSGSLRINSGAYVQINGTGTYKILDLTEGDVVAVTYVSANTKDSQDRSWSILSSNATLTSAEGTNTINGNVDNTAKTCEYTMTADGDMQLHQSNGLNVYSIIVTRSMPIVEVPVTTYGWATFNSDSPLDLTNVDFAYKVTGVSGSAVTIEAVTEAVEANTPLLIKGTTGSAVTLSIPIAASGSDISSTNKLIAVTADGTEVSKAAVGTNYVLAVQSEKAVFAPIDGTEATLNKGQAYLALPEVTEARALFIDFEGETTGISNVEGSKLNVEGYYNLAGQRVAQPTKGLYIVNGKKVVVK